MTLYEYTCKEGLQEILNFMWNIEGVDLEDEGKIFARLGYQEQPADLYSSKYPNWMNIYKNFKNNEYEFLIRINNHIYSQYVACRSFVEYLGFLRLYLPVLRTMNDIAVQTARLDAV